MTDDAFFRREGATFVPNPVCRGPWDPKSLHGRVVAGLLAAEIERQFGDPGFQPARLTIDLWRLPDFTPIEVTTTLVREGGRIKVADAECFAGGKSIGRASASLLRRGAAPETDVWSPPPWNVPPPQRVPPETLPADLPNDWKPMWEMRPIGRHWGVAAQKRAWIREVRGLFEGETLTPFQRVALAADFASPLANSGAGGLAYINTDITLYLHRLPAGEWLGFESVAHHAAEGVAVGECMLYDEDGPIGRSITAALAQRRNAGAESPPRKD
jgi:acyl-CoA thioesterase